MSPPRSTETNRLTRRTVLGVFLFFVGLFSLTNPGTLNAIDTWRSVGEAAAIVESAQLRFDDLDPEVVGAKIERCIEPTRGAPRRGVNKYGAALNLAYVPAYVAAKGVARLAGGKPLDAASFTFAFVNPIAGALLCVLFLMILAELEFGRDVSIAATAAMGIGTYLWPITGLSYSDPLQAAAIAAVGLQALRTRQEPSARRFHLLGALCVLSVLSKTANAPLTGVLALLALRSWSDVRRAAAHLIPWGVAGATLLGWVSWVRFGHPTDTGYTEALFGHTNVLDGLFTLLVSADRGLVWFFPLAPVALAGVVLLRRTRRWIGTVLLVALPVHVAVYVTFEDVHGGQCLGPRYLLVLLPILGIGLAEVLRRLPSRRRTPVALIAIAATAAWVLPMTIVQYFQYEQVRTQARRAGLPMGRKPLYPPACARLLSHKTPMGPDELPLALFTVEPTERTYVLSDWDNSGWQWWWIKPHPRLPGAVRYAGALFLAGAIVGGMVLVLRDRTPT